MSIIEYSINDSGEYTVEAIPATSTSSVSNYSAFYNTNSSSVYISPHVPNPFVDFKYGNHYASDFNLLRVSNGSRYNNNIIPTLTEQTTDVPGGDGMYYFNTFYKQKQFTIDVAFDHLTEEGLRDLRVWLNGKEIHDLIFDEAPNITYKAKVTGAPSLKYIPFDEPVSSQTSSNTGKYTPEPVSTQLIYKGEGSIQFTCYDPFGYGATHTSGAVGGTVPTPFTVTATSGVPINDIWTVSDGTHTYWIKFLQNVSVSSGESVVWNSATGIVKHISSTNVITVLPFKGISMGNLDVGTTPTATSSNSVSITLSFTDRYY